MPDRIISTKKPIPFSKLVGVKKQLQSVGFIDALKQDIQFEELLFSNFINLSEGNLREILEWRNHPEIHPWMFTTHLIPEKEHFKFIEKLKEDTSHFYFVGSFYSKPLGVAYFNRLDLVKKSAFWGLYTCPDNQIKGAGAKLSQGIFQLAFDFLGLKKLQLEVLSYNQRAIRFYKRLGFKEKEIDLRNILQMELTRKNYEKIASDSK